MTTVTLYVLRDRWGEVVPVEMPSATTGKYAAKRAAEAMGYDPYEHDWMLEHNGLLVDPDEVVAELDCEGVRLVSPQE